MNTVLLERGKRARSCDLLCAYLHANATLVGSEVHQSLCVSRLMSLFMSEHAPKKMCDGGSPQPLSGSDKDPE